MNKVIVMALPLALVLASCQEKATSEVATENQMCQEVFDAQIKTSLASKDGIDVNDESTQATFYGTSLRYHIDQCAVSSNPANCSSADPTKYLSTKINITAESIFEMPTEGSKQKCQVTNLKGTTTMQLIPNGPVTTYAYTVPLFDFAFTLAKDGVHYTTEYMNDFPFNMDNMAKIQQNNLNALLLGAVTHNTEPEVEVTEQVEVTAEAVESN